MPQIGAVLVPINYRLTADDFAYIINHSGATVVCAHADYLEAVDSIRDRLPGVEPLRRARGRRATAGSTTRQLIAAASPEFARPEIGERDLLTINYTSGTTARPKGVMITHRNAYMNVVGTLLHLPMAADRALPVDAADVPRQRLDVRVDRDRGRRHATSACARSSRRDLRPDLARERITMLCAAPTVLIGIANAPAEVRARRADRACAC